MHHLRKFLVIVSPILLLTFVTSAQRLDDVLATSKLASYTAASLSPAGQKAYLEQRKSMAQVRTGLLDEMIRRTVVELESKELKSTTEKLLAAQRAKVPDPTQSEIQTVYDTNRAALGGRPLESVRDQIVEYLKHEAEHKVLEAYVQTLRTKYKVVIGRDVNAIGLASSETVASIGSRVITLDEFEKTNRVRLNDMEFEVFEGVRADLEASIMTSLASEEAKERKLDTASYIAAEITDKLRLFTDDERRSIESALMRRLFGKYAVKILLREPTPIVQNILIEADDPQTGTGSAPVTVVMFTDFQCPACSRTHPLLQQAVSEYGNKVRFVVRDFPLDTIHENAFQAALAANAARAQGRFFEYTEILYRNQDSLDRDSLLRYAAELGLNAKQFELDFSDAKNKAEVQKDQADGRSYGVGGTPAIFVNGIKVQRLSVDAFRRAIDRALLR